MAEPPAAEAGAESVSVSVSVGLMGWLAAILLTALAVGLLNASVGYLIAQAAGMQLLPFSDGVVWLGACAGALALAAAVLLWRRQITLLRSAAEAARQARDGAQA